MLESLLVALREGIEAALVVAIVLAYLRKSGRAALSKWVLSGLVLAVLASVAGAVVFSRYQVDEERFEGTVYFVSALLCGSMLVWMARTSKTLKRHIEGRVESLLHADEPRPLQVRLEQHVEDRVEVARSDVFPASARAGLGLLLFTFFMVFREGVECVALLSAVQLNTEAMKSFTGTLLGLGLAVAFGVFFVKGTFRIDLRRFFAATTAVLAVLVFQLLVNGLHEWSEAGIIPSSERSMSILGPIVRSNVFFLIAVVAVPSFMLWSQLRRRTLEPVAGNPAERRKALAEARAQRRWGLAASASAVVLLTLLSVGIVWSNTPRQLTPATPVAAAGGEIRLRLADVSDGALHRFALDVHGVPVRFFALKTADGKVRTAVDACEICGAYGYVQEREQVICLNCTAVINPLSIGKGGGCNPIPLASEVKGDEVVIPVAGIATHAKRFAKGLAATEVDPVCGMKIDPANAKGKVELGGKTYYFCNEECLKAFQADPSKFAR